MPALSSRIETLMGIVSSQSITPLCGKKLWHVWVPTAVSYSRSRRRESALILSHRTHPEAVRLAENGGPTRLMSAPTHVGGYLNSYPQRNSMHGYASVVGERIKDGNARACARGALKLKLAMNFLHSLAHVAQALGGGIVGRALETPPIVVNGNGDLLLGSGDAQLDF